MLIVNWQLYYIDNAIQISKYESHVPTSQQRPGLVNLVQTHNTISATLEAVQYITRSNVAETVIPYIINAQIA